MGRLIMIFACLFLSFIVTACGVNDKESYLKSFENFIVDIEQTKKFSKDDITQIKKNYLDYAETYYHKYETELSASDEEFILKLKTRYYTIMTKQGLKGVGESLKEFGEQASDFINEILE